MSLHYLAGPVAILCGIIAITLVVAGIYWLAHSRRALGAWMLVGGILLIVVPLGATAAWNAYQERASWDHTVSVQGLDPTGDPEFTVDIRHHQTGAPTPFTYGLEEAGDFDAVRSVFQEQHPDGVAAESGPFVHGDLTSAWHVYLDGARFDLFEGEDGLLVVATQIAALNLESDAGSAFIPFPSGTSPMTLTPEVTIYLTDLTPEQWRDFYDPIDGVAITDTSIAVPTSTGGMATLTFKDEPEGLGFTVSLSD